MIRRVLIPSLLLAVLASAPRLAQAQDETKPKPAPVRPLVQKPAVVEVKPLAKPDAGYYAFPAPLAPGAAFTGGGLGSGGLANGGLHSRLPVIADGASVCRARCAKTRYVCLSTDDPVLCDPAWIQCLATCGH